MENESSQQKPKFSDYLYILFKWKKFIIVNLLIVGLIATLIAFLIPNQYKATATIMIPPQDQMGLGGLTSLLGGKSSIASAGTRLLGMTGTSEDLLLGIINSRSALTNVINKFNLMQYYEIDDNKIDKAIRMFKSDINAESNEFGLIEFSVVNKDSTLAAKIANYLVALVDSMNIEFNIQHAKSNRIFIEKRYFQNVSDLQKAEDSLYGFQKKFGIVAVPEQLEVSIKAAAEIESQLTKKEIESYFILQGYGENSPQYQGIQAEINLLKKKVQELKNSPNLSASSNILFAFKDMPNIAIQYLRSYREVQIQQSILEIVMPMYEQAKVEEQKSMPTIMVVDKAVPPNLKHKPKRSLIIISLLALSSFVLIPAVFRMEKIIRIGDRATNKFEEAENRYYTKIQKAFRI